VAGSSPFPLLVVVVVVVGVVVAPCCTHTNQARRLHLHLHCIIIAAASRCALTASLSQAKRPSLLSSFKGIDYQYQLVKGVWGI
jgi:hypothetical protein